MDCQLVYLKASRNKGGHVLTKGAHTAGPIANPSTKRETPTIKTSLLMFKSRMISVPDSEYAEDVNVTAKTDKVTMVVMNHFLN